MFVLLRAATIGAAIVAVSSLAGCRDEEQGRPLSYEKGVYQGALDEPIDEETRRELRDRIKHQSFN